jgi:hypothetical protein
MAIPIRAFTFTFSLPSEKFIYATDSVASLLQNLQSVMLTVSKDKTTYLEVISMKNKLLPFLTGALVMLMLVALPVSALASDGALSLKVYPINILVDGEVFQPTDASGSDVMVFTYNGTTYAPLRALAEAYGLTVGYDSSSNTATVTNPAKTSAASAAINDFASMWTVTEKPVTNYGSEKLFTATYNGSLSMSEFKSWWRSLSADEIAGGAEQLAAEAQRLNPGYTVTMYFSYGQYSLGTAYGFEGYQQSNFKTASVWIK